MPVEWIKKNKNKIGSPFYSGQELQNLRNTTPTLSLIALKEQKALLPPSPFIFRRKTNRYISLSFFLSGNFLTLTKTKLNSTTYEFTNT
jgi:hypothetical protein